VDAGSRIRVFVANNLRLKNATFTADGDPRLAPGPAIAFVVRKDTFLEGTIQVGPRAGGAVAGCVQAGPGGVFSPIDDVAFSFGGGGGGNATDGADGGAIVAYGGSQGSDKGHASGTSTLEPLRGGCSGGFAYAMQGAFPNAGGAAQFSSGRRLVVQAEIDARGGDGMREIEQVGSVGAYVIGGGGAGGSVLLEAPTVELVGTTKLLASGGTGAQACPTPQPNCSLAGTGATRTTPAQNGMDLPGNTSDPVTTSGGGGGGLGVLRINTADETYIKNSAVVEDGSLSVGRIRTR
jgi:hypothetical protein